MLLLLNDETSILLPNEDAKLSDFLEEIIKMITPEEKLFIFLRKKKHSIFRNTITNPKEDEYLKDPTSLNDLGRLKKFIDDWCELHLETIRLNLKPKTCEDFPNLSECFNDIFDESPHRLSFIKEDLILKKIVEFLRIPNPHKSKTMFNDLCRCAREEKIPTFPCWESYEIFINQCTSDQLLKLCEYSYTLGIDPLMQLVAFKLSFYFKNVPEHELRILFQIPVDFRNSTLEMVEKYDPLSIVESWMI